MKSRFWNKTLVLPLMTATLMMPVAAWAADDLSGPEPMNSWETPGGLTSGQDLKLGQQRVDHVQVGRDLYMNGTIVTGDVQAGRQVAAADCQVMGDIQAGRDVELRRCSSINAVSAGRNIQIVNSTIHGQVKAAGKLTLFNADINASVYAGGGANIENTNIAGTLNVASPYLRLLNANIQHIRVIGSNASQVAMGRNSSSSVTTTRNGSVMTSTQVSSYSNSGKTLITVGSSSVSNINGYTVKGSPDSTTLLTPDGNIYVNGRKVSGNGPENYSDYLNQVANAPNIMGPGWINSGTMSASTSTMTETTRQGFAEGPVVELTNNSVVKGKIIFEGGQGRVIVHHGSTFDGEVEGGSIERI